MQVSNAIFPKHTITLILLSSSISLLKKLKQFLSSTDVGLSCGGTHLRAVVKYASISFNPSSIFSELVDYYIQF